MTSQSACEKEIAFHYRERILQDHEDLLRTGKRTPVYPCSLYKRPTTQAVCEAQGGTSTLPFPEPSATTVRNGPPQNQSELILQRIKAETAPPEVARSLSTGTGFFVAEGVLLTAKHVVRDCVQIDILSETVEQGRAMVIATDEHWDIAVLRTEVPATRTRTTLPLSVTPAASSRLIVYGYPLSSGDARRAVRAQFRSANGALNRAIAKALAEPGWVLWLDGPIEHGYSGGPVLDADGTVAGVVFAIGSKNPALDGHSEAVGTWPIMELLAKAKVTPRVVRTAEEIAHPEAQARAGIVRIVCWRAKPTED